MRAEIALPLAGLATGVQLNELEDYDIISATIRYDIVTNLAIKAEVSKLTADVDSSADSTLLCVGVNYVF